jgi:hypothetical protein
MSSDFNLESVKKLAYDFIYDTVVISHWRFILPDDSLEGPKHVVANVCDIVPISEFVCNLRGKVFRAATAARPVELKIFYANKN